MPKKLTLMRHAKSSWADYSQSDMDRPLSPRGKKDAPKMGRYLYENDLHPDLVLCSPAQRTRETLARLQTAFGKPFNTRFDKSIYSAGMGHGLISLLHSLKGDFDHVMIVGHNPAMQELAQSLVNWTAGDEDTHQRLRSKFSTGSVISMEFDGDNWTSAALGQGKFTHFMAPKLLG